MMKKFLLLMSIVFIFAACQKGHNYTEKKSFVVTEKMKEEMLQKELEKNRIETCDPPEEKIGFFKRVKMKILSLFTKKDTSFDIIYPEFITNRVLKELKAYIFETQSFMPEKFWLALKPQTKTYLDTYLIENFVGFNDEQFKELRDVVAFSFLFYFQEKERMPGYEIHLDKDDLPVSKVRIAYTEDAKFEERKKISICDQGKLLDLTFQDDGAHLTPSKVNARVTCEERTHKVRIDLVNDTDFSISMASGNTARRLKLHKSDLEVNTSNRKPELIYNQDGNEFRIVVKSKTRDSKKQLKRIISLKAHLVDGSQFDMPRLSCESTKPLILE